MSADRIENLQPRQNLNNDELCALFKCSPQGGMRRAHETNTLVIVSNHVKAIYEDRWDNNDVLHYTGMGQVGDQKLRGNQNITLYESRSNGVDVHLFEVFEDKVYSYTGQVELADEPYMEDQPGADGHTRKVYVFPLKLKNGASPSITIDQLEKQNKIQQKQVKKLSDEELKARAQFKNGKGQKSSRNVVTRQYVRDQYVVEYTLRRAKGICQLCLQPAPFKNKEGRPFLEVHHIVWLAQGGEDSISNTVALCPNCHRKMHILNDNKDIKALKKQVEN